jgi:hypothetical protein
MRPTECFVRKYTDAKEFLTSTQNWDPRKIWQFLGNSVKEWAEKKEQLAKEAALLAEKVRLYDSVLDAVPLC